MAKLVTLDPNKFYWQKARDLYQPDHDMLSSEFKTKHKSTTLPCKGHNGVISSTKLTFLHGHGVSLTEAITATHRTTYSPPSTRN